MIKNMSNPSITFFNLPSINFELRDNTPSIIKGNNDKKFSVQLHNIGAEQCKLRVRISMKDPKDIPHFYQLIRPSDKCIVPEIERDIGFKESVVDLDFFKVKKPLKKDSMKILKEKFGEEAQIIYKKNSAAMILNIDLINKNSKKIFDTISHEFGKAQNEIIIAHYSPNVSISYNEGDKFIAILKTPENDTEAISMEVKIGNSVYNIQPEVILPNKKVYIFLLKPFDKEAKEINLRLCRNDVTKIYSKWIWLSVFESNNDVRKRKFKSDDSLDEEFSPLNKLTRQVSSSITENISQFSSFASDISKNESKQLVRNILEHRRLSSIARVGHDFAIGREVTDFMRDISKKLPVVFILQDDVGDTPLHNAILKKEEERALFILEMVHKNFPSELYIKNTSNHTALILSPACGVSPDFVQKLIDYGFDLREKDIDGNNALCIAIQYRNSNVLQTLVRNATRHKVNQCFDFDEVMSLVKQTVMQGYFDGFKILMESELAGNFNYLEKTSFDLDEDSMTVLGDFFGRLNMDNCITPFPELNADEVQLFFQINSFTNSGEIDHFE